MSDENTTIIPVQFLNWILNNNTIGPIQEFDIDESYFPGYEKEFNYIVNYWKESKLKDGKGCVPDKVKFAYDFPDFPLFDTGDAINTMYHELLEQKCYSLFVQEIQASAEKSKEDSFAAIEYAKQKMDELYRFANRTIGSGKDLIKGANERLEDYIKRIELHGLLGIKTGFDEMDKALHGWLPEDLVLIIARTNEGKSWLLLYYLIQACLQGKKVGLYSGEMSQLMVGFRFDTMYRHFSNTGLIGGDPNLGDATNAEVGSKSMKEYQEYITALLKGDLPEFRVFTQKDLEGKLSVNKMKVLQDRHNFDIWGIDQLSLMADDRKGREERIRYSNISEDLFSLTEDMQKPILLVHQAGRKAAESKKKDAQAVPELEDAFGADAIAQNATRVMSFTQVENGVKIVIPKNRYGMKGMEFFAVWNINYGIFKQLNSKNIKDNLF